MQLITINVFDSKKAGPRSTGREKERLTLVGILTCVHFSRFSLFLLRFASEYCFHCAHTKGVHGHSFHCECVYIQFASMWLQHEHINCSRCDWFTGGDGGVRSTQIHNPLCISIRIAVASILVGIDLCACTLFLSSSSPSPSLLENM